MTKTIRNLRNCFLAMLAVLVPGMHGQTPDLTGVRGLSPTGLYNVDTLDSIDPTSGNMMFRLPITAHAPTRAGFISDLALIYNSNFIDVIPSGTAGIFLLREDSNQGGGWQYGYGYGVGLDYTSVTGQPCASGTTAVAAFRMVLAFPDGGQHTLHLYGDSSDIGDGVSLTNGTTGQTWGPACPNYTTSNNLLTYHTSDGTYVKVVVTPGTSSQTYGWAAYFPDGKVAKLAAGIQTITDRNGNAITIQNLAQGSVVTALGDSIDSSRNVQINYHAPASSPYTFQDTITQDGVGANALTWTVYWRNIPDTPLTYTCPYAYEHNVNCPMGAQLSQIDSVILPSFDGSTQKFQFAYDTDSSPSGGYGQLNLVIPPTAPTTCTRTNYSTGCPYFSYTYQGAAAGLSSVNYTVPQQSRVLEKQQVWIEDQTGLSRTNQWKYAYSGNVQGPTTITNPDSGTETVNWSQHHASSECPTLGSFLVDSIVHPDQSEDWRTWQQNIPYGAGECDPGNFYVGTEYHSVSNGSSSQAVSAKNYTYDKNGNVTELDEYGFAAYTTSPPTTFGTKLRSTLNYINCGGTVPCTNTAGITTNSTTAYWNPATNPSPATAPMLLSLVERKEVDDPLALGPGSVTEFGYDTKGNILNQYNWDSTKASKPSLGALTSSNSSWRHFLYDSYGNVTDATDPLCTTTKNVYDSQSLYLTSFTEDYRGDSVGCTPADTALTRTTTVAIDHWSGLETSRTDYNGITRATAYDPLGRTTSVTESAGGATLRVSATHYSDGNRRVVTCSDRASAGDQGLVSVTAYDELGRVNITGTLESGNPNGTQCVDTAPAGILTDNRYLYGSGASYKLDSNPYRSTSESTMGWTLTSMDTLGRVTSVTSYDGATPPSPWGTNSTADGSTTTAYSATSTTAVHTVSDQVETRTLSLDGLGRTTSVVEAGTATTAYVYDAIGNLDSVSQSGVTTLSGQAGVSHTCSSGISRCFAYDSLSRLSWATNPESGTTSYLYDANGNLTSKTDARSTTTTLAYDQLSLLHTKTYSDGITPAATYTYATATSTCPLSLGTSYAIGHLISVSNSVSSYAYDCYDGLGRILHGSQTTNSENYPFTYSYNAAGSVTSMTYPSGRHVTYSYDNDDRATTVTNATAGRNYWSGGLYAPNGAIASDTLGNTIAETNTYNHKFQPVGSQAGSLLTLSYFYCASQASSCTSNNGNVQTQTIKRGSQTWTQNYSYTDGMNRLNQAVETGPGTGWTEAYTFDNVGNRWVTNPVESTNEIPQAKSWYWNASSLTNNRVIAWSYDNAGNILSIPALERSSTYDAENRQISATINGIAASYTYDSDGHRITKAVGGASATIYVYAPTGQLAAEYGTPTDTDTGTRYLTADPLGTTRLMSDVTASILNCYDYLPFGQELQAGTDARPTSCFAASPDSFNLKFTGKERDAESGLDWFNVRYFSGAQGRFTSPDQPFIDQDPSNPQSWNLYNYGRNNPLRYSDPTGRNCVDTNNGPADDGTGGGCAAAGVDANGNITPQTVNAVDISQRGGDVFVNGQIVAEGSLENDYAADFGFLGLLRGTFGSMLGGAGASATETSVWGLGNFARGNAIERMLGANLPRTFPTIDKFINGVATSIKSVDLTAVTYQNPANLARLLTNYVDKVAEFPGATLGGYAVDGSQITGRALEVAVPQGAIAPAQQAAINSVVSAAAQKGVQVILIPIR